MAVVCRLFLELTTEPSLWRTVDLAPTCLWRNYGGGGGGCGQLIWLASHRLSQCMEINLNGQSDLDDRALKVGAISTAVLAGVIDDQL